MIGNLLISMSGGNKCIKYSHALFTFLLLGAYTLLGFFYYAFSMSYGPMRSKTRGILTLCLFIAMIIGLVLSLYAFFCGDTPSKIVTAALFIVPTIIEGVSQHELLYGLLILIPYFWFSYFLVMLYDRRKYYKNIENQVEEV